MSCQPYRVTSGQSNSGHKQILISKLFSHIYQPSVKSIYKTNHFANIKHTYTNIIIFFEELVPSILPLLKEHIRLRTCWYRRPFCLIYCYQVKEKYKKEMDRHKSIHIQNCMENISLLSLSPVTLKMSATQTPSLGLWQPSSSHCHSWVFFVVLVF